MKKRNQGGKPQNSTKYVKIDVEGPEESFFDAIPGEATQGQEQAMQSNNNGGGSGGGQEEAIELHQAILDVIHLDVDDIQAAGNAAPMVDNDNMPAVANIPQQSTCRILGLTAFNSLLQYVNWLVWEVCSVN